MEDEKELIALKMADLIVRRLNAELNASEEVELLQWLNADPAHLALYDEMADQHSGGKALTDIKQYDVKAAFQRFENKIKTPSVKLWPRIAAVAAILLVVGTGLFFYINSRHLEGSAATRDLLANDIKPGTNRATLTLSNGSKISLTDAKEGDLAKQSGLKITKTSDGQLVYENVIKRYVERRYPGNAQDLEKESFNTIETPRGGQYQVRLPDGSKVWLNAASKLTYSVSFNKIKERRVELSGEAYFEIAKIEIQSPVGTVATSTGTGPMMIRIPFFVKSNGQEVQVLGTHFNINSYANEPTTRTTLLEGLVRINTLVPNGATEPGIVIEPNEQAILKDKTIQVVKVDPELAVAWKNGQFAYKNTQLQTVMNQIARWYDVEIIYENESLKQKLLSGSVSRYANVSGILKAIESTGTAKFKIEGKTIKVQQ